MTDGFFMHFLSVLFVVVGIPALIYGGFCLLLTSGGDRGGDSGVREQGCVLVIAGALALIGAAILRLGT